MSSTPPDAVVSAVRAGARTCDTPEEIVQRVIGRLSPSIRLVPNQLDSGHHAPGGCKLGGLPDLPVGTDWPTFTNPDYGREYPFRFLMQVDLSAVAPFDIERVLPPTGVLHFFLHWQDDVTHDHGLLGDVSRVLFCATEASNLRPASRPVESVDFEVYDPVSLSPAIEWTVPSPDELGLDDHEVTPHLGLWSELDERVEEVQGFGPWYSPKHRMLGYADLIQAPGLADGTILLAQVDSDVIKPGPRFPRSGMMWGDAGRVYYLLDGPRLTDRRFSATSSFIEMC